ncbi:uncharacterized protein LOC122363575 [Amphibalanus amphitrite]|uniref:uncharacterized protein LOC122363575 n=1 Tax=Amphibalanus amphitrite TaxID=1232801 RepID=UPI001C928CE3|nr:uncharacterized protein LOC122363575 [Amphibalanus amphitrite]
MDEFRANGRDSPLEEPPDLVSLSPHRQPARPDWELRGVLWSRYWQVCRDYSATYNSGATYRPADRVCGESAHHGGPPASDGRPAINGRGEGLARSALGERPDLPPHRPPRGGRSAARKRSKQPNHCVFCKNNNELPCVYRSHILKDDRGRISCPILRVYTCPTCGANGDNAHTVKYCPRRPADLGGRQSAPSAPPPPPQRLGRAITKRGGR